MLVLIRLHGPELLSKARDALQALARRPGFVTGRVGHSPEDVEAWVLVSEWESVGAYRRAIGSYDVKLVASQLFSRALDEPAAYEVVAEVRPPGGPSAS